MPRKRTVTKIVVKKSKDPEETPGITPSEAPQAPPKRIEKQPYSAKPKYAKYVCRSCGNTYREQIVNDILPIGYLCANDSVPMRRIIE